MEGILAFAKGDVKSQRDYRKEGERTALGRTKYLQGTQMASQSWRSPEDVWLACTGISILLYTTGINFLPRTLRGLGLSLELHQSCLNLFRVCVCVLQRAGERQALE